MKIIPAKFYTVASINLVLALLSIGMSNALAAGPSAQALSYTCAGCHGTDGSSLGPSSPHIAGIGKEYFIDAMKTFQADERNSTIMNRIARAYTNEQIEAMATFFSEQELRLPAQNFDPKKAALGAKLHDDYCEKCHEDGGAVADDFGTLAGQWVPYLEYSMADYRNGSRYMTKKMKKKVKKMLKKEGESSIEAVFHFYASQK